MVINGDLPWFGVSIVGYPNSWWVYSEKSLINGWFRGIPSGKPTVCHSKSSFLMSKSTISMAMFKSHVSLPKDMGNFYRDNWLKILEWICKGKQTVIDITLVEFGSCNWEIYKTKQWKYVRSNLQQYGEWTGPKDNLKQSNRSHGFCTKKYRGFSCRCPFIR